MGCHDRNFVLSQRSMGRGPYEAEILHAFELHQGCPMEHWMFGAQMHLRFTVCLFSGMHVQAMDEPDLETDPLLMPGAMPLLFMSDIFHLPGCELPLWVSRDIQSTMVDFAMKHDEMFAIGCSSESGTLFPVATAGTIKSVFEFADGTAELVLLGIRRVKIVGLNQLKPFPIVRVESFPYSRVLPREFDEWHEALIDLLELRTTGWNDFFSQISNWVSRMEDPTAICDVVGNHLIRSRSILRELLSEESTQKRMELVLRTLSDQDVT